MMRSRVLYFYLAILVLTLVACAGNEVSGQGQAPAEAVIVVDMNDIYYGDTNDNAENPPIWRVSRDAVVTLRMENMGALEHNWTVLKAGEDIPLPFDEAEHADRILLSSDNVAGGASAEFSFTAPEPGEYNVVCTVPGHAALMQGRLFVKG